MKRIHFLIALIMLTVLLVISGCSGSDTVAMNPTPTPTPITTPTPSSTPSPTPSPTSSPSPTPSPTPTPTPGAYEDLDAELLLAPDIIGLTKTIKLQEDGLTKVIYIANTQNEYSLDEGKYAGEYKRNVFADGNEVGGIAVVPLVAQVILDNEIEKIPEGEPKIKIVLPLDISASEEADVKVSFNEIAGPIEGSTISILMLNSSNAVPILWIVPDSECLTIYPSFMNGINYDNLNDVRNSQYDDSDGSFQAFPLAQDKSITIKNNPMSNNNLLDFIQFSITDGYFGITEGTQSAGYVYKNGESIFGESAYDDIKGIGKEIGIYCAETSGGNYYSIRLNDILSIDDTLIFMTSEK